MKKRCARCKKTKSVSEFHRSSRDRSGYQSYCKCCVREHDAERSHLPHRRRSLRDQRARREYGLDPRIYRALLGFNCQICGRGAREGVKMVMDHCHASGENRGPLCKGCNMALGLLKDDPEILRAAIRYLDLHQQEEEALVAS